MQDGITMAVEAPLFLIRGKDKKSKGGSESEKRVDDRTASNGNRSLASKCGMRWVRAKKKVCVWGGDNRKKNNTKRKKRKKKYSLFYKKYWFPPAPVDDWVC